MFELSEHEEELKIESDQIRWISSYYLKPGSMICIDGVIHVVEKGNQSEKS